MDFTAWMTFLAAGYEPLPPPLLIWEGELASGASAVLIMPTLREADPLASLETPYLLGIAAAWGDEGFASEVRRSIRERAGGWPWTVVRTLGHGLEM